MNRGVQGLRILGAAALAVLCSGISACGNKVAGHTYAGNDNLVKIEFDSGGKAYASYGPMTSNCTYTQDSSKVTLICDDVTTVLTLGSDGILTGPPDGMMARLTRIK
jgi:hypothetical protein